MSITQTSLAPSNNVNTQLVVPASVERMREGLLASCADLDSKILRELLRADETSSLETALDRWLLEHLNLDDERIAQALFHVLLRRFFDELEVALQ